ncbi:MAG: mechanosensitive ion channel domain-containing protein [Nitrospirota bacterium]
MDTAEKTSLNQVFYDFQEINFLLILFIFTGAFLLIFVIQKLLPQFAEKVPSRFRLYILPLAPILRLVILLVATVTIIPLIVRPTFQNFLAIFGAAGLAIGFAFKDYVSSLIAGVVAIYEQPYRPGDWVQIDEVYGEVKSLGLRSLQILTPDDTMVSIPHSKIWNTNIFNANSGSRTHLCVTDFYLHPEHDASLVRQKLMDVALTSPYLEMDHPVAVMVKEKPWGTYYRVKAYPMDNRDEFQFISDLTVRGKVALSEIGAKPVLVPVGASVQIP